MTKTCTLSTTSEMKSRFASEKSTKRHEEEPLSSFWASLSGLEIPGRVDGNEPAHAETVRRL